MSSIHLRLSLLQIFSNDVSNIILKYTIIICQNCMKETSHQIVTYRYNKCNGWLCKKCDTILYQSDYDLISF